MSDRKRDIDDDEMMCVSGRGGENRRREAGPVVECDSSDDSRYRNVAIVAIPGPGWAVRSTSLPADPPMDYSLFAMDS
jgi:hypothetical protein